ncbi:hypothetical protein [Enterobacter kobei]|uniref:hypothetical protein n=1 Tax=Enterobacter kobei TaxID=208224 RepID=UPI0032AEF13C
MKFTTPSGYEFTLNESNVITMTLYVRGFTIEMTSSPQGKTRYSKVEYSSNDPKMITPPLQEIMLPRELAEEIDLILRKEITVARSILGVLSVESEEPKNYYKD